MAATRCPGSGQRPWDGAFPGDKGRCATCGASVPIRQDETCGAHRQQHGRNAAIMASKR